MAGADRLSKHGFIGWYRRHKLKGTLRELFEKYLKHIG